MREWVEPVERLGGPVRFGRRELAGQRLAGQVGQDFTRGAVLVAGPFLRREQHIVVCGCM